MTGKQRLLFSFKRSKASAAGSGGLASRGRHIIQGGGCGAHHGARPAGAISRAPGAHYLRRRWWAAHRTSGPAGFPGPSHLRKAPGGAGPCCCPHAAPAVAALRPLMARAIALGACCWPCRLAVEDMRYAHAGAGHVAERRGNQHVAREAQEICTCQRKGNGPYPELLTLGLACNTPRRRPLE